MNTIYARTGILGMTLIVLTLAGCGNANTMPLTANPVSTDDWRTYTSTKHKFSIQYPPGWQFKELPVSDNLTQLDQVLFAAEDFPPPSTGVQPDLTLIITGADPSARWGEEYFDDYRSEVIQAGEGQATRISGINKESLYRETVVIMKLHEGYLQILPGQSEQAVEFFDRIVATFDAG